jgi:hypothetical protein
MVTRKKVGIIAGCVAIVAAATTIVIAVNSTDGSHDLASSNYCTPEATRQLPQAVVKTVNTELERHPEFQPSDEPPFGIRDILTHPVNRDWEDFAFVEFLDRYCGFRGNVNGRPVTEAGKRGQGMPYTVDVNHPSRVQVVVDNAEASPDFRGICISNSVPTAAIEDGAVVMTVYCDRSYPEDSWLDQQPTLTTPAPK